MVIAQTEATDTITRNVLVESVYNPILATSEKRSFLPEERTPIEHKENIVYAESAYHGIAYDIMPVRLDGVQFNKNDIRNGYLHLGYGNYNNVDALASYVFKVKDNGRLALGGSVEGWNGSIPYDKINWHSNLHDMNLKLAYDHSGANSFRIGAHLRRFTFNYILQDTLPSFNYESQKAISYGGFVHFDGSSTNKAGKTPFDFSVDVSMDQWLNNYWIGTPDRNIESHITADVSGKFHLGRKGYLAIGVNNDYLGYGRLNGYNNYYAMNVCPQWLGEGKLWSAALGLNIDTQTAEQNHFQFSPACHFIFKPFSAMQIGLTADGGRALRSFEDLYTLSPYWASECQLNQSYTRLNAKVQGDIRLAEGLHLSGWGAFRSVTDALFATGETMNGLLVSKFTNANANIILLGGNLSYTWKDIFQVSFDIEHSNWTVDDISLLAFAPELTLNASAKARIFKGFSADAGICYTRRVAVESTRISPITDLHMGADYAINSWLNAFIRCNNILNYHYSLYPAYPTQGIHGMLGISCKF